MSVPLLRDSDQNGRTWCPGRSGPRSRPQSSREQRKLNVIISERSAPPLRSIQSALISQPGSVAGMPVRVTSRPFAGATCQGHHEGWSRQGGSGEGLCSGL
jgi:hypothetical protein